MKITTTIINEQEYIVLLADDNKIFSRIYDGFQMGDEIILGYDYSTGIKRKDLPEYYEEVNIPEDEIE